MGLEAPALSADSAAARTRKIAALRWFELILLNISGLAARNSRTHISQGGTASQPLRQDFVYQKSSWFGYLH
jgi:hypothetical protein